MVATRYSIVGDTIVTYNAAAHIKVQSTAGKDNRILESLGFIILAFIRITLAVSAFYPLGNGINLYYSKIIGPKASDAVSELSDANSFS